MQAKRPYSLIYSDYKVLIKLLEDLEEITGAELSLYHKTKQIIANIERGIRASYARSNGGASPPIDFFENYEKYSKEYKEGLTK